MQYYGYCLPCFSFVCKLQGFQVQIFEAQNKKSFGSLVEISTEFLNNIDFQITETRFTTFLSLFLLLNKYFVRCLCTTCAHEHFKLCAHFYPLMNIL